MEPHAESVRLAYSYAWWLTGEDEAAARAVATVRAVAGDDASAALAAVRRSAITERTMCPASEVALLHDRHGLPLPEAARLAEIDADDARTELAHGRLEALAAAPGAPFRHPERLGGLAVGNPADVAHARQCDDCGRARELLEEGREALRALPEVAVPAELTTEPARRPRTGLLVAAGVILVALVLMLLAGLAQDWAGPGRVGAASDGPSAAAQAAPGALGGGGSAGERLDAGGPDPAQAWDDTRGWLTALGHTDA